MKIATLTASILALTVSAPLAAQTPAFGVTGTTFTLSNPSFTLGYQFTLSRPFRLTGLGLFDEDGDGLADAHDIGLYNSLGSLIASTTLGAGTAGRLQTGFRYNSVVSQTLGPGVYTIGALYTSDGGDPLYFAGDPNMITGISGITYNGSRFISGDVLSNPIFATESGGYVGPNMLVANPIPEAATWGMMILGFGVIGATIRRRKGRVTTSVAYA